MITSSGKTVFTSVTIASLAITLLALAVQPVTAAQQMRFANGATYVQEVQWIPNPVDPARVSGPSDGLCAAAGDQPGGAYIQLTFAPFAIPAGNIVQGIEARLDYETVGENDIRLHNAGTLVGNVRSMPAADGPSTCDGTSWAATGGPMEMWGTSLTIADFNAGNIGFRMTQPIVTGGSGDPGSRTVDIDAAELVVYFGPANTAPTADAGGPYPVPEGGSVMLSGVGSTDPDQSTASLTFEWDLDNNGTYETPGMTPTFSAAGLDGPTSKTVGLRVTDNGSLLDTDTATVNITNVAPTVVLVTEAPDPSNEGVAVVASATYSDPGTPDTHTCTVDYGDGSVPLAGTAAAGNCTGPAHVYVDDNPSGTPSDDYTVTVTVTDDDGGSGSNSGSHTVDNVAPTVGAIAVSSEPSNEGEAVSASAGYTDPGSADTHSCTVDYGDGSDPLAGTAVGGTCTGPLHVYVDDNPSGTPSDDYTVTVTVTDDDGGSDSNSGSHTVDNVAPSIDSIVLSATSIEEGDPTGVTATGTFSDPALGVSTETFGGTAEWSDGSSTALTVNADGTFETSRTFPDDHPMTGTPSDVLTVDITITDDDTGSDTATSTELTVDNVEPTISATTNSAAECGDAAEGMPVDVTAEFFDPGFGPTEDWAASTVDWGDGSSEAATVVVVPGSFGTPTTGIASGSHVYASGGIFTVTITVIDDDTGSDSAIETALVTGAGLTPAGLLGVVGTGFLDVVGIQEKLKTDVVVNAGFLGPGKASFSVGDVVSIEVRVCDGNDQVHVNHDIVAPSVLVGGPGPDHLRGGSGYSLIEGGSGNDHLFAGKNGATLDGGLGDDDLNGSKDSDILMGGEGNDKLAGDKGDDLLDGGPGIDDCNPGKGNDVVANCEE